MHTKNSCLKRLIFNNSCKTTIGFYIFYQSSKNMLQVVTSFIEIRSSKVSHKATETLISNISQPSGTSKKD